MQGKEPYRSESPIPPTGSDPSFVPSLMAVPMYPNLSQNIVDGLLLGPPDQEPMMSASFIINPHNSALTGGPGLSSGLSPTASIEAITQQAQPQGNQEAVEDDWDPFSCPESPTAAAAADDTAEKDCSDQPGAFPEKEVLGPHPPENQHPPFCISSVHGAPILPDSSLDQSQRQTLSGTTSLLQQQQQQQGSLLRSAPAPASETVAAATPPVKPDGSYATTTPSTMKRLAVLDLGLQQKPSTLNLPAALATSFSAAGELLAARGGSAAQQQPRVGPYGTTASSAPLGLLLDELTTQPFLIPVVPSASPSSQQGAQGGSRETERPRLTLLDLRGSVSLGPNKPAGRCRDLSRHAGAIT